MPVPIQPLHHSTLPPLPERFPSPFANDPHSVAKLAAEALMQDLPAIPEVATAPHGKMFGVLVVRDHQGELGYLSAFSGMINGSWQLAGFVPPIFDADEQERALAHGDQQLKVLSSEIETLEQDSEYLQLQATLQSTEEQCDAAITAIRDRHQQKRYERKIRRQQLTDGDASGGELALLALASQHDKRKMTDAKAAWQQKISALKEKVTRHTAAITAARKARSELSRTLHRQLFDSYQLQNWAGEHATVSDFFDQETPPAGAGDCAGAKLIHYACKHRLAPIAMAEFWWGASPSTGIRHHAHYYPACRGKCFPILPFMLNGIAVEPEPDHYLPIAADEPKVIFEDSELLVINKPAGLLTTPGKSLKDSVLTRLQQRYPELNELKLVHRLDMATSGLLVVAKTDRANRSLQRQFIRRTVEKHYEALLSRPLDTTSSEGEIDLPLRPDLDDRPRQLVCFQYGKRSVTRWRILNCDDQSTRIQFTPLTGRTHQLRMHAAHPDGLNAPIIGDALYGDAAERLMLHAASLAFAHPITKAWLKFEVPPPF